MIQIPNSRVKFAVGAADAGYRDCCFRALRRPRKLRPSTTRNRGEMSAAGAADAEYRDCSCCSAARQAESVVRKMQLCGRAEHTDEVGKSVA